MSDTHEMHVEGYTLAVDRRGGAITRFDYQGLPLFRTAIGPSPFDQACFPLVPFSNRIRNGRFHFWEKRVELAPNFPGGHHPHPLHGDGWLATWAIEDLTSHSCTMTWFHEADAWPWSYRATQRFELSGTGFKHSLAVRNLSVDTMPVGLGLHPYFPRNEHTIYHGLHRGELRTADDGLPIALDLAPAPTDWWRGKPVSSRVTDTVYAGRCGMLTITWPDRALALAFSPSNLNHTVVYAPPGANFFCVEPVSHATDAFNRDTTAGGMTILHPGQDMKVRVRYAASRQTGARDPDGC